MYIFHSVHNTSTHFSDEMAKIYIYKKIVCIYFIIQAIKMIKVINVPITRSSKLTMRVFYIYLKKI